MVRSMVGMNEEVRMHSALEGCTACPCLTARPPSWPTHLPASPSTCLPAHVPACLPVCLPACLTWQEQD